jgi:hypothetical protein
VGAVAVLTVTHMIIWVSPDRHCGSVTTFVTGDSYAIVGSHHPNRHHRHADRDRTVRPRSARGHPRRQGLEATDFNFWGVTFANDGRHFYATLGTGGQTYLIEGDLMTRRASVIVFNMQCPSLSPDNTQIAFQQRIAGSGATWRRSVLDVDSHKVHHLAETRNVDDQVEWLNNTTIIYGVLADRSIVSLNPLNAATPQHRERGDPAHQHLERPSRRRRRTPALHEPVGRGEGAGTLDGGCPRPLGRGYTQ